jgi:WD40 repeat protein
VLRINSEQLITTSADFTVKLWTLANGNFICGYFNHSTSVRSAMVSKYGQLITGGCDGTIKVWDTTGGGALLLSYAAHVGCVNEVKFHPTIGALGALVSVGADRLAKVWTLASYSYALVLTLGTFNQSINCFVILSTGHMVFGSNRIDMWDTNYQSSIGSPGFVYPTGVSTPTAILSMAVLSDGVTVACGMDDGKIRLFNTNSKTFDSILIGHMSAVNALVLIQLPSTSEIYLMSGSDDRFVFIWELSTNELVKQINMSVLVKSLAFFYNDTSLSKY